MITKSNWYKTWFDSPLYDTFYAKRDDLEAEKLAHFIYSQHPPSNGYSGVLDLACGRGRHSLNFAKLGYTVTGSDLSEYGLSIARKKAKKENLDIKFIKQDMRSPLYTSFNMILNLFTSFGYFEDDAENEKVISNIHQMLTPGGVAYIDYLNPEMVKKNLIEVEEGELNDFTFTIERAISNNSVNKKISIFRDNDKQVFNEHVKLYNLSWFREQLEIKGLRLINTFGSYSGEAFDENRSTRMLMLCLK